MSLYPWSYLLLSSIIIHLSFMWIAAAAVSMYELVMKWVRVDVRMTKTYKTFFNGLFKRPFLFECWLCVCFGWLCQVCKVWCALVCVCYVLSLHWRFESDVGGEKRHTELVCSKLKTFRGFHKDRSQQVITVSSRLLSLLFYPALPFWFLAVLIETDKPIHGNTQ